MGHNSNWWSRRFHPNYLCGFLFLLGMAIPSWGQSRLYVNADLATGANDGTSWENAFRGKLGLRNALNSVNGLDPVEIWVAQGEYTPSPPNVLPFVSFGMKNNTAVVGGFIGIETDLSQRNHVLNPTILQGDLNGSDDSTCANLFDQPLEFVIRATDVDDTSVLDGFVIRSGYPDLQPQSPCGAGMKIEGGSPIIRNCNFEGMYASEGSAMLIISSSPLVEDCTFKQNSGQVHGGAIAHGGGSSGTFRRCLFEENQGNLGGAFFNGPLRVSSPVPNEPTLEDCDFIRNMGNFGAPIGGGLYSIGGSATLERCRFIDNTSTNGGGIHLAGGNNKISDCIFVGNLGSPDGAGAAGVDTGFTSFTNCVMTGGDGGCGHAVRAGGATVTITNCTITSNGFFPPPWGHAAICGVGPGTMIIVTNTIVWNNADPFDKSLGAQLMPCCGSQIAAYSSVVQDWDGSLPGVGTVNLDPLFVDPIGPDGVPGTIDDDLRLSADSPCIDAGNNNGLPPHVTTDVTGLPRRVDDPNTADTGNGTAPIVDIGAFEFQICFADLTVDGVIDLDDWSHMHDSFGLETGAEPSDGDFDHDEDVDIADFVSLQIQFGFDCP